MSFPKHVFIEKYPKKIETLHSFHDYTINALFRYHSLFDFVYSMEYYIFCLFNV